MPVSPRFLIEFARYRSALLAYRTDIVLLGGILYLSWGCAMQARLIKDDLPPEVPAAICRRMVIGQSLSLYAFGAALCVFNTYWKIAFMVLVQLYYAIGPRLGKREA